MTTHHVDVRSNICNYSYPTVGILREEELGKYAYRRTAGCSGGVVLPSVVVQIRVSSDRGMEHK